MSTRVWYGGLLLFVLYGAGGTCDLCTFMNQTTSVSSCSASCGGGQQYYYRYVCCLNLTRSDCESHCNLNLTLTKSIKHFIGCGQECYGGGAFNETTESCLCPQGTTGPCCDPIIEPQNTTTETSPEQKYLNTTTETLPEQKYLNTTTETSPEQKNFNTTKETSPEQKNVNTTTETSPEQKYRYTSTETSPQQKSQNTIKGSLYVSVGVPLGLISTLALVLAIIYFICMKRKRNHRVDAAENVPDSDEIGTNRSRDTGQHKGEFT
uniref:Uncharacterized protein LOC111099031 isoform X3 n=1 Tax=Crassostrea virginica TaxID=6565 RepID=A0A8B8A4F2_CRAVI|nr:uncharacterized protein LOC111099031 isoform X3 [Crassostrea virginica]